METRVLRRGWGIARASAAACLLVLAGCSSAAPSPAAAKAASPAAPPAAATAATPSSAAAPSWPGSAAWQDLQKLNDFAYQSVLLSASGGQSGGVTVTAQYHSPTDYKLVEQNTSDSTTLTLIQADDGHLYLQTSDQGTILDLGANGGTSTLGAASVAGITAATAEWSGLFGGATGTSTGTCSVAGRSGTSFKQTLSGASVPGVTAASMSGTTCIDQATGAPLQSQFSWSVTTGGQTTTLKDSLTVTQVGGVPDIPAPAGAQAMPAIPGLGGATAGGSLP